MWEPCKVLANGVTHLPRLALTQGSPSRTIMDTTDHPGGLLEAPKSGIPGTPKMAILRYDHIFTKIDAKLESRVFELRYRIEVQNTSIFSELFEKQIFVATRNFYRQQISLWKSLHFGKWPILGYRFVAGRNFWRQQKYFFGKFGSWRCVLHPDSIS